MKPFYRGEIDRRAFLELATAGVLGTAAKSPRRVGGGTLREVASTGPILGIETDPTRAGVPFLGWDTEGGNRARRNLLRANSALLLRARVRGQWHSSRELPTRTEDAGHGGVRYRLSPSSDAELQWTINPSSDRLVMSVTGQGSGLPNLEAVEMLLPFDPQVTPTTVLPQSWSTDDCCQLPAVISAPDHGQILMEERNHAVLKARLEGSRTEHTADLILELPAVRENKAYVFNLTPAFLPPPEGLTDQTAWQVIRRGWFNAWQPSARWGEQNRPFSAPAGILSNNVISDPASCSLPFYADQALWTPEIAAGISAMSQVRRTIDWWLDHRTDPTGEVICYWDYRHFLDSNSGILISAWDYVEATGDRSWLRERIDQLELLSAFTESRDIDHDGMVEATQSGDYGTLWQPARSCCWFDAVNCGHKDGYSNAAIYRAWRCLSDLEAQLGRTRQQAHYSQLADRLKSSYAKTLYNPKTRWLAWWKSADGSLHDYATPIVNGLAIEYGLVEPNEGRKILARLWQKMEAVGFTRVDLGVPSTLIPIRKGDYIQPEGIGMPKREDGTDTFQTYQNGGIPAGQALHFIMAHHRVGEPEKGDRILHAMLGRQTKVGFHNGVRDKAGEGMEWTTWDGKPGGYEGYLADVFIFLQAVLLREPSFSARFYRPLTSKG